MAVLFIIGLILIYIAEVKYKETNRLHNLYARAFSCLQLQDNTNWWFGKNHTQSNIESGMFRGLGFFFFQLLAYGGISFSSNVEVYIILGLEVLIVIYFIYDWKHSDKSGPDYSISDIKLIMQDFRDHKDRLKELYDLRDVDDQDAYLNSVITHAEFLWIDAYNKGYDVCK